MIRFSAVKRAVFTFIGIYDENHVERIAKKLLELMGQCLRDRTFCEKQFQTEDVVAINTALWAIGFYEAQDAISAMQKLIEQGTENGEFYCEDARGAARNIMYVLEGLKIASFTRGIPESAVDREIMYVMQGLIAEE